jgi:hypothetical protein
MIRLAAYLAGILFFLIIFRQRRTPTYTAIYWSTLWPITLLMLIVLSLVVHFRNVFFDENCRIYFPGEPHV